MGSQKGGSSGSKQIFQSTLIEKEKKQLDKIRLKQVKNLLKYFFFFIEFIKYVDF